MKIVLLTLVSFALSSHCPAQLESLSAGLYRSLGAAYYGTNETEGLIEVSPGAGYGAEAGLSIKLNESWQLRPTGGLLYAARQYGVWFDDTTLSSYFVHHRVYFGLELNYLLFIPHKHIEYIAFGAAPQLNLPGKLRFKGIAAEYPKRYCDASLGTYLHVTARFKTKYDFNLSPFVRFRYTRLSGPLPAGSEPRPEFMRRTSLDASGLELGLTVELKVDELWNDKGEQE